MTDLSPHAAALADQLDNLSPDQDAAASVVPFGIPLAERAALLDSIGKAIAELRAAGRDLTVETTRVDNGEVIAVFESLDTRGGEE